MTNDNDTLPLFAAPAPAVFRDPDATANLFVEVLEPLAGLVDLDDDQLEAVTPCAGFAGRDLRDHVLGWLQYFAAALNDPAAEAPRPDSATFVLGDQQAGSEIVYESLAAIRAAVGAGVAGETVTMQTSRMNGDAVLAMALGEYIVHAWDLAAATGQDYAVSDAAVVAAHEFLVGTVTPEFRGPDSGFYDVEVVVASDAARLDHLVGFAGRDPRWAPPR